MMTLGCIFLTFAVGFGLLSAFVRINIFKIFPLIAGIFTFVACKTIFIYKIMLFRKYSSHFITFFTSFIFFDWNKCFWQ